ncbi:uncharacterized protein LOC131537380 isoform X2 [Onychostoma macrolepis]|uniref:uncharacterized protein LOC131537380 isoform X2 n=1 Tax=Onychostoma macrolepis TaxID=369639 RepID=UPI00272C48DB|nr:uncharacterized protein LOC131537380 isoform X2 [Onychostoma macrolepis]
MPLEMGDLRIVLLGKSVSENSQVGNFILGRAAFDSESPSDDVVPYSDRVRGKHVTVINTPLLLNPDLSLRHITQAVKECLSLSAPGPHVIILVLKPDECSRDEKVCIEILLSCFSDRVFQHTLVLTTQEPERTEPTEVNHVIKEIIKKCWNRHSRMERSSTPADLIATVKEIVQENEGCYLNCNKCEDFTTDATERDALSKYLEKPKADATAGGEASEASPSPTCEEDKPDNSGTATALIPDSDQTRPSADEGLSSTTTATHLQASEVHLQPSETVAHIPPARRRDSKSRMPPEMSDLRIVLLGKSVSENSQVGNFILGRAAFDSESPSDDVVPYSDRVRGKHVTVINTPLLLNPDLSLRHITQAVKECLSLSAPGPHVIILVLKPDECSRDEKVCIEILLSCFSDRVFQHTLVLTTQEPERTEPTEVNHVMKEIIKKCWNRHSRMERSSTPADLIATVKEIVQENEGCYLNCNKCEDFTTDATERAAQVETAQEKAIRHCQSAVNDKLKISRETTSSENMGPDLSNAKALSVAQKIKDKRSRKIEDGSNENLPMFKLHLDETWQNSDGFCRRSTFGKTITKENKTIMMIGATGAGKTTLINSMINFILGVEWEDDFRFVLIDEGKQKSQAESQTSQITAYQINHMDGFRVPYSLTIVDTPGFGDTRGISHDQKIIAQIHEFFCARGGIDHIDAVCFVVQASLARLTHTQKYIFDSILSIFGKDIAQNILVLVTFADGKAPPVLEAIKVSQVPCSTNESGDPLHFKFNNSAMFATNNKAGGAKESDWENFDQMFWNLGFSSMTKFFISLNMMQTKSLSLTQEVLTERQQLEVLVERLQPQINAGLTKLNEIRNTYAALEQHKAEMDANKDFEYEIEVTVPKQIKNTSKSFLTNCQNCHFTCHDTCAYANDSDKDKCSAMKNGKCNVCPGKCVWNVHFNQKYKWDYVTEKRKETYQDLKKRYAAAHGQVMSKEKIFEELENELDVVRDTVAGLIKRSQMSLKRLQEIALKPNPLSVPDYIDLMIESEKQEAKPGFKDRIRSLSEVRKKADLISKVSKGEVLPQHLKEYKRTGKKKTFSDIKSWFNFGFWEK